MLDKFRETAITWDKATRRIYSPISANESDSNGRKLNIQVVNSGQVENLAGATLHLYWETKDKAQYGLDAFTASDITKGEFEIFYTTGMLSNVGELNATLVLVDGTGKVVSDWFKITVTRGINEGAIQSENSFSSLTQALIDVSNLEQNYTPRLNDLAAQLQQTEQSINAQLAHKPNESDVYLKNYGININDLDEPTRKAFLEAQGIEVNYVLGEGNVAPKNTTFINTIIGPNKFDKTDPNIKTGKYVDATGYEDTNIAYGLTGYIPVNSTTTYEYTDFSGLRVVIFYDYDRNIIRSVTSEPKFTTTEDTAFVRLNFLLEDIDSFMVFPSNEKPSEYVPYTETFKLSSTIHLPKEDRPVRLKDMDRIYNISEAINHWGEGKKFPVAFMGDSTTDGVTVTGNVNNTVGTDHVESNAYPYLLEQKLKTYTGNDNLRIYNAGFSGWSTASALNRFDDIFGKDTPYSDTKMIGFVYGINDRPYDIDTIIHNLEQLCLMAYERGVQPFFVTPQTILQGTADFSSVNSANRLVRVVRAIKDFAKKNNIEVIDMNKATVNFLENAEIPINDILTDTLHFGDVGHEFEAGFLFSQFIWETIEVKRDTFVSVTDPRTHYAINRAEFLTDPDTFRRYVTYNNVTSDKLLVRAYILNSSNKKLRLTLGVSDYSNFYFKVDGLTKMPSDVIELEIGQHEVEIYAGAGTTGKYYGFNLGLKK